MANNITIKAHNVYRAIRHLDDSAIDYEQYENTDGTVHITIKEVDSEIVDSIIDKLQEIDIG